jgi:type I restriction enzyme S subunit
MIDASLLTARDDRVLEWIGGLPSQWEVKTLGSQFVEHRSSNRGMIESRVLSLSYGRVVIRNLDRNQGLLPASFETYQVLEPGDIVIRPTDLQNDHTSLRVAQTWHRGVITSAYLALRPTGQMSARYGAYILKAYDYMKVFYGFGSGLRQNLDFRHIRYIPVPVPSKADQDSIVRYLDHAELRITRAIQAKTREVLLLWELEQQAILRALRGDCTELKTDEKADWLGPFPASWPLVRLGSVLQERDELNRKGEVQQVLSLVRKRGVILYEDKGNIGNKKSDDITRYKIVRPGDIVLNSMNVIIGSVGMSRYEGCLSPVYYVLTTRDPAQSTSFFNELLQIERFHKSLVRFGKGILSHRLRISMLDLKAIMVPLPPTGEQHEIAERVRAATGSISDAIRSIQREIDLLSEYRIRLIADVITGKKDVRIEAANLPNVDPSELAHALSGALSTEDDIDEEVDADAD